MSEDLVAFIRARLDDEKAAAERLAEHMDLMTRGGAWGSSSPTPPGNSVTMITAWTPARVLREVEAIRAIVDHHTPVRHEGRTMCVSCLGVVSYWPCPTLMHLGGIWRDHADYTAVAVPVK